MQIASVNVNGIRAAFRRGMGAWLDQRAPDVLLLQEVRAPDELLAGFLPNDRWHVGHAEAEAKGRAGVAIASRLPVTAVRIGLDQGVPTNTGRWIEADLETPDGGALTVVSAYIHSGTENTPSMDEKYAFLALATERMDALLAGGGHAVVGGDLNIAHRDQDLKNWKDNRGKAGCLPE
ncbi:exodeoxyribonuclease III, partial [Actinotalea sp.]|uniref:exodeoxyribonuclease III n=1 Tax=Actinotalea sp. TaxID=1872145 RepID=UPI00356A80A2